MAARRRVPEDHPPVPDARAAGIEHSGIEHSGIEHAGAALPVVLGWGLGVESSAVLTRWLLEPATRDFALDDLIVLTALTGDEFAVTHELVEAHVLPLLRDHAVRWVQVARAGQSEADGIVVVDDSAAPAVTHRSGPWRLSDELVAAGTVPQVAAGRRLCSIRAKGSVLDRWIAEHVDGPFRHVLGFNADETVRVLRDRSYSSPARHSEYPLLAWGWDRATCEEYLASVFGVAWHKSCCVMCPFRGGAAEEVLVDWAADPAAALEALTIERRAMALNPNMALYGAKSALDLVVAQAPWLAHAFADHLHAVDHALVEVRRVLPHAKGETTRKAPAWRATAVVREGPLPVIEAELRRLAVRLGAPVTVDDDGIARVWRVRRRGVLPDHEWVYAVAPAGIVAKARPGFEARWNALVTPAPTLFDVDAPPPTGAAAA